MRPDPDDEKAQKILKELDETLAKDVWSKSSFLKAINTELVKIRSALVDFMQNKEKYKAENLRVAEVPLQKNHHQPVFISVYSSEGMHLQSWERIIANLPRQMVSRPIYLHEEDAQNWIKFKENKINEGYICIFIKQDDLLEIAEDRQPKDKFGKPLLVLKDRSIHLDNIQKFVHQSGNYRYVQGRLQKI